MRPLRLQKPSRMNCKITILSVNNIKTLKRLYCAIYQPLFANFKIGKTSIIESDSEFLWNETFNCHLVRGINFAVNIIEKNREEKKLLGRVEINCFNIQFSKNFDLPIMPKSANSMTKSLTTDSSLIPYLTIRIDQILDSIPIRLKNPANKVPLNSTIYVTISFQPNFSPSFPCKQGLFDFIRIPLDISFVSYDIDGNITNICTNSICYSPKKCCHSGNSLCYSYDTFGPTLRIDLFRTFFSKSGFPVNKDHNPFERSANIFYSTKPSIRGILLVSLFDQTYSIDHFDWISLDIYLSQENHMKTTQNNIIMCEKEKAQVYFHSRIPLSIPKKGSLVPFTIGAVAALTSDSVSNIEISPIYFSVPNKTLQIPTYSVTEILPEIAQVAQFPIYSHQYERFVACPLGCCASLSRGLFINHFPQFVPKMRLRFSWAFKIEDENTLEMDASVFAITKSFQVIKACTMNNKVIFDGGMIHNGFDKSDLEEININFQLIPANVSYLCITMTSLRKLLDQSIHKFVFAIAAESCNIYKVEKKKVNQQGIIVCILKRESNDWTIAPVLQQTSAKTPTLIQDMVVDLCKRIFSS